MLLSFSSRSRLTQTLTSGCRLFSSTPCPALLSVTGQRLWQPHSFINGEFVSQPEGKTFDVFNPATGDVLASVPRMMAKVNFYQSCFVLLVLSPQSPNPSLLSISLSPLIILTRTPKYVKKLSLLPFNPGRKPQHWSVPR